MRTDQLYEVDAMAARSKMRDILTIAAREQIIHEARNRRRYRPRIAEIGHRLVRLGQWLQTMAHHPIYKEETV